jgi:hypothetical protein
LKNEIAKEKNFAKQVFISKVLRKCQKNSPNRNEEADNESRRDEIRENKVLSDKDEAHNFQIHRYSKEPVFKNENPPRPNLDSRSPNMTADSR